MARRWYDSHRQGRRHKACLTCACPPRPQVPVFVFGEKRLFHMINLPKALQRFCLKRVKIPLLLFW